MQLQIGDFAMTRQKKSSPWKRMHLIDRCLFIFMLLLISQSVYNLFAHEIAYEDASSLDSALRTTTSGIFGYFISGGTATIGKSKEQEEAQSATAIPIGFQSTSPSAHMTASTQEPSSTPTAAATTPALISPLPTPTVNHAGQQVIIVTLIGLISLVILIVARNFASLNTTTIATLSQFRDFTSGSVGFLIGRANNSAP